MISRNHIPTNQENKNVSILYIAVVSYSVVVVDIVGTHSSHCSGGWWWWRWLSRRHFFFHFFVTPSDNKWTLFFLPFPR